MTLLQILPVLAYLAAAATILAAALGRDPLAPGALLAVAGLFAAFTAWTLAVEGLTMFWTNHTTSLAGNQVWFDLLIAVVLVFVLLVPRARAAGMAPLPWGIAVIATASLALLPFLARLIWLERRRRAAAP